MEPLVRDQEYWRMWLKTASHEERKMTDYEIWLKQREASAEWLLGVSKRLLLIVGFFPVMIYGLLRWIVTGADGLEPISQFDRWVNK